MNRITRFLTLCIIVAGGYSCEESIVVRGQVLSYRTGLPLDSALIQFVDREVYTYTDTSGNFVLSAFGGNNLSSEFIIKKPTYKPFRMKFGRSGDFDGYFVFSDLESYEFPKPAYINGPKDSSSFVVASWVDAYSNAFAYADHKFTFQLDTLDLAGELARAHRDLERPSPPRQ